MNGPLKMYQTRQIIRHDLPVELPNCMYKMKNILSGHINSSEHVSADVKNLDITEQVNKFLKKFEVHPDINMLELRQEKILQQLAELKEQILLLRTKLNVNDSTPASTKVCRNSNEITVHDTLSTSEINSLPDLVINVNPSNLPYSLVLLQKLWANSLQLVIQTHLHSTVTSLNETAKTFEAQLNNFKTNDSVPHILIRLIWKEVDGNLELITSSLSNCGITGEVNLLRYLSRIGPKFWNYELFENWFDIDSALDICYMLACARTKTERSGLLQSLNGKLGKSQWLCNRHEISIADIAASSVIKQVCASEANVNLTKWLQRCEKV